MVRRGSFIGGQDNLSVPDAPTIGAATAGSGQVSVAFTAPSDVGDDPITGYGASATDGTNVIGGTGSSSPVTISGLTNGTSYTAQVWAINDYGNGPLSAATSSFSPSLNRAVFGGGTALGDNAYSTATGINVMEYVTISSAGNVTDFGDLIHYLNTSLFATMGITAFGNDTRGIFAGGVGAGGGQQGDSNIIQYITLASTGNATDFGDLSDGTHYLTSVSNNVRGVVSKGKSTDGTTNEIEYVTIQSTGNTTDFGDLTTARREITNGNTSSKTRGIFAGGRANAAAPQNTIDYITMASAGNATDFGDMTTVRGRGAGSSSETRTVMAGGFTDNAGYASASSTTINVIDYITTASTGDATDFGDLSATREGLASGSSSTTSVFGGGNTAGGDGINVIESITIASTSNTTDFGDLSANKTTLACCASHAPSGVNEAGFAPAAMGVFGLATGNVETSTIEYINIASTGNSAMFGDMQIRDKQEGGVSSSTRFVASGGQTGSTTLNVIDHLQYATKGKSADFGDLTVGRYDHSSASNGTRGIILGGTTGTVSDVIDYVTIASASNATDFGDLTVATKWLSSTAGTTRLLKFGGYDGSANTLDTIEYITIASTGDMTDFGDLLAAKRDHTAGANATRALVFGGNSSYNVIQYVTIASTGDATDFGDLSTTAYDGGVMTSSTRAVYVYEYDVGSASYRNSLEYVTIASTGDTTDFGDMLGAYLINGIFSASNSHGGIS